MSAEEKLRQSLKVSLKVDELNPLTIPDMDTPEGYSEGLGWAQLDDETRAVSLIARLPEPIHASHRARLFWTATEPNSQPPTEDPLESPVQTYPLDEEIIEKGWLSFTVLRSDLNLPSPLPYPHFGYFYYSLYDVDAETTNYSDYRPVLIDLVVPGGLDPDTDTPINEYLQAPQVKPDVIDATTPEVVVTVPMWRGMQVDDQLTLVWNGVSHVRPRLVAADVGKSLVFTLPKEVIDQGFSGKDLPVYYYIRDRVQNYSRPSYSALVEVVDPNALAEPIVKGAESPPYQLDLTPLRGADVQIEVPFYNGFAGGDTIALHWVGQTAGGQEVAHHFDPRVVNSPSDLIFQLPHAVAALVVKGSARVYYESTPAGGAPRPSRTRTVTVVGEVSELLPPTLDEAVEDAIDLANLTGTIVHVRIPLYPGQMEGDTVTMYWTGQAAGGGVPLIYYTDLPIPPGGADKELVFEVSTLHLLALVDGTLTLHYTVYTPAYGITRKSGEQLYSVVDTVPVEYPAPTCAQVQGTGGDAFLPSDTPTAVVVIPDTSPLRPGQVVTLHWAAAVGNTPPPHEQTATFQQFPFSFNVTNTNILPFEDIDVSVTYSVA
ncbi:hypothetical protein ACIQUF_10295 [Pseudomonas sp. NPDC090233]|uniref:hypothetical protein n=1 Tax=Pseudomonas sp. NPDC090233 TaxID=3364479 RepID=UPI00383BEC79